MMKILVWKKSGDNAGVKQRLRLNPDSSLMLKIGNPAVSNTGTFSYPITVPYDQNKHIFDFPAAGEQTDKQFAFELYIGNDLFMTGDAEITDAAGIEIYLKSGNSSVLHILRNSYLDDRINRLSWGAISDFTLLENSLSSCYPDYDFVAAPVKWDKGFFNYFDFTTNTVKRNFYVTGNSDMTDFPVPGIYVRYLLKKIIEGCNFVIETDQTGDFADFNRLAIWAAREVNSTAKLGSMKYWMPHITASELLDDLLIRFGLFVYFNPMTNFAEILFLKNIFDTEALDWTHKLIGFERFDSFREKSIVLRQEGDDEDTENPDASFTSNVYDSFEEAPDPPTWGLICVGTDENKRFFKRTYIDPGNSFPATEIDSMNDNGYYFRKETERVGGDDFYKITKGTVPNTSSRSLANTSTAVNVNNKIVQFVFPANQGEINVSLGFQIDIKTDADTGTPRLYAEVLTRHYSSGAETLIGSAFFKVHNTTATRKEFIFRIRKPRSFYEVDRLIVRLSSNCDTERTITVTFGGEDTALRHGFVMIDALFSEYHEIAAFSECIYGDTADPEEIKPKSLLLKNDFIQMDGHLFEMPVTDLEPAEIQEKYAMVIYRGRRREIGPYASVYCGHFNFDDKAIFQKYYTLDLFDRVTPELTLRFREEKGTVEQFLKEIIFRKRYAWRGCAARLRLSMLDIAYTPLYVPRVINGQKYMIAELSVPIGADGTIGEITAELITI